MNIQRGTELNEPHKNILPADIRRPTKYVETGTGPASEKLIQQLSDALGKNGIRFFYGCEPHEWVACLNIHTDDRNRALELINKIVSRNEDCVLLNENKSIPPELRTSIKPKESRLSILCVEEQFESEKCIIKRGGKVLINLWSDTPTHLPLLYLEANRKNMLTRRMKNSTFVDICAKQRSSNSSSSFSPDPALRCRFPIDVVYTWVNDRDPHWQAERRKAQGTAITQQPGTPTSDERFRNRDELRYSLRSLDMFAPWVQRVFIVTNGQVPEWLNLKNPKIRVVTHSEIYRDPSVLPTFNSSGIETQLHHIPGLAEHFLYFNDDFFLGSLTTPDNFFMPNGMIKSFPSDQRVFMPDIDEETEEYLLSDVNAMSLITAKYGNCRNEIMLHAPYACRKSLLLNMEKEFQREFDTCAGNRFRSRQDLRPIAFMQFQVGLHERLAVPSSISHRYVALWKPWVNRILDELLEKRNAKTFCLNDVGVPAESVGTVDELVHNFLKNYFPFRSQYETAQPD